LGVTRGEVELYLAALGQQWREDESNLDRRFARNRVRHDLLPLLEREFNPNIRQVLSYAAELSRAEEEYWQQLIDHQFAARFEVTTQPNLTPGDTLAVNAGSKSPTARLNLERFAELPVAVQRRLLKRFAEISGPALDFEHIEELRRCALGKQSKMELPRGFVALHERGGLSLRTTASDAPSPSAYEYVLTIPGEAHITELGLTLRALVVAEGFARELAQGELLRAESIGAQLTVRNWRAGDRFWPSHSASEEKLKRLFAERRIPAEERPRWPVVLCGEEIVWVRGFPVAKAFQWKGEGEAVRIDLAPSMATGDGDGT
jgi:tRNA(Ile)-lysidine synthase